MKVLFVYSGNIQSIEKSIFIKNNKYQINVNHLDNSHMSEVAHIHIIKNLLNDKHDLTIFSKSLVATNRKLNYTDINNLDYKKYDVLFIFKIQGLINAKDKNLLSMNWAKVVAWLDSPRPESIMGEDTKKINHYLWATRQLLLLESSKKLEATHTLSEYATIFNKKPRIINSIKRGFYAGRLPKVYLDQLQEASKHINFLCYALTIEIGNKLINLRDVDEYKKSKNSIINFLPDSIELHPAKNLIENHENICASFGLVTTAENSNKFEQIRSSCKFFDYIALGLPVLINSNIPESIYVRKYSFLGELYNRDNLLSYKIGIKNVSLKSNFKNRKKIQDWAFKNCNWIKRSKQISQLFY